MIVFTCVRDCQWRGRIWRKGEAIPWSPGEDVPPRHFRTDGRQLPCPNGTPERETDFLVIIGDSPHVAQHIAAFSRVTPFTVAAVNRGVSRWPGPVHFMVSLHVNFFFNLDARGAECVSDKCNPDVGNRVINATAAGGSGGLALQLGMQMGFPKILLLGIELTATGYVPMRPTFERIANKDRIRSMGGWTADLFGLADTAWMEE
jgi:hypothetical protein